MPLVGVERTVIHEGKDFRRTRHLELPRFLVSGIELARKMLGLDLEILVVPRNVDRVVVVIEAVLAHEGRLDADLAAMLVLDRKLVVPDRRRERFIV